MRLANRIYIYIYQFAPSFPFEGKVTINYVDSNYQGLIFVVYADSPVR